jgi:hypothetical protein
LMNIDYPYVKATRYAFGDQGGRYECARDTWRLGSVPRPEQQI